MDIKRFSIIMISIVFISLTNYAQDSSYIKENNILFRNLYINFGAGYSTFSTLSDAFDSENCFGYHFGIETKKTIGEVLYWGIEAKFEYIPSKFSEDVAEIDPGSFSGNMNFKYIYVKVFPKIGIHWKPTKLKWPQLLYSFKGYFNYAEFNLGFGRAFYNIDQLFNSETENNQYCFNDSELLHSLNSEFIFTTGGRLGRNISEKISLSILIQLSVGLEQSKHYEGEWISLGYDRYWSEAHTNRMAAGSFAFSLTYNPF
jgi:hypothetical protein